MSNVFNVVSKLFDLCFLRSSNILSRILVYFNNYPYLILGTILMIIGFSVGIIKRIIRS